MLYTLKDIEIELHLQGRRSLGGYCDLKTFLRDGSIKLEEEIVENILSFKYQIVKRDSGVLWIVGEPICKFYQGFNESDIQKYGDHMIKGFGLCKNLKDSELREKEGCFLTNRVCVFIPSENKNQEKETQYTRAYTKI